MESRAGSTDAVERDEHEPSEATVSARALGVGREQPGDGDDEPGGDQGGGDQGGGGIGAVFDPVLDRLDDLQRRWVVTAFLFGLVKKFTEDRAGQLAALVAYFTFFSIFPLMLVLVTALGFVLSDNPELQDRIIGTAVAQLPVVGEFVQQDVEAISGNAWALAVGLIGASWGGLRAMTAGQNALNEIWDVPMMDRPNFLFSRLRGLLLMGLLAGGVIGSIVVANVAAVVDQLGGPSRVGLNLGSILINVLVVGAAFQVLTDLPLKIRQILPGAVLGGVAYWGLQLAGSTIVRSRVSGAEDTYGTFALVIGLLTWLFVLAQVTLLAAEVNVVWSRRLWPRSLTGRNLTRADVEAFAAYARQAKRNDVVEVHIIDGVRPGADAPGSERH